MPATCEMTNFILIDAPDFVLLVASEERAAPHPLGQPQYLNPALSELVQLLGSAHGEGGCSAELTFEGTSFRTMRRILKRYGFDLPPLTVGELYGLLEYCDRLDAITGNGMFAADQLSRWQRLSEVLNCDGVSPGRDAIRLYSAGDLNGLRGLHREQHTLVRLGLAYRDFADSLSHLAIPL